MRSLGELGLLGRHAHGGPQHPGGVRDVACAVFEAGEAEVDHPGAVSAEDHVAWLEIAVQQARRVDVVQPFGEHDAERGGHGGAERAAFLDVLRQGEALDVLGGEPRWHLIRLGRREQGRDPWPGDHAEDDDLPVEPVFRLVVLGEVLADRFDRDPVAVRRDTEIHGAHAALTKTAAQHDAAKFVRIARLKRLHAHLPCSRKASL